MKAADVQALMRNVRSSAAPVNPMTPNVRQSPSNERLDALQKVRKSLELVDRTIGPEEMTLKALVDGMRTAVVKLLQDQSPESVMQSIAASVGSGMTPPAPMAGMPPAPPPGAPMGPTAGAPAMPPGGAVPPVSPGSSPG